MKLATFHNFDSKCSTKRSQNQKCGENFQFSLLLYVASIWKLYLCICGEYLQTVFVFVYLWRVTANSICIWAFSNLVMFSALVCAGYQTKKITDAILKSKNNVRATIKNNYKSPFSSRNCIEMEQSRGCQETL